MKRVETDAYPGSFGTWLGATQGIQLHRQPDDHDEQAGNPDDYLRQLASGDCLIFSGRGEREKKL